MPRTSRPGFYDVARGFCKQMVKGIDDYETILDRNEIWQSGRRASGSSLPPTRSRSGSRARCCARPGSTGTYASATPYLAYDEVDFDVPVYRNGDVYDRYRVHMDEMRQSVRIISQCLDRLQELEGEPWIADDRKVVLPPRHELHTSMESLIHHFKIVTEGYTRAGGRGLRGGRVAPRRAGLSTSSRTAGTKPWRVKFRAPSFAALQATATCMTRRRGGGHDRDRRVARRRHGRGRPVSQLADEIRSSATAIRSACPRSCPRCSSRSSDHGGWLPEEAFREVAEALDLTPAYCLSIASFYDMFRLEPVGEHLVEVCTNISCGLNGAQQVVEALESELGVRAGGTSRRRRLDAAHGRVPRRVWLGDDRRRQQPAPPAREGRGRSGARRGADAVPAGGSHVDA